MPEGPEIWRAAARVADAIVGQTAKQVSFGQPHLRSWGPRLSDQRVLSVHARGKAMLTRFENGIVYSHNQLYGRWYVGRRPKTSRQLRFAIPTSKGGAWLYSASDIEVHATLDGLEGHPYLIKLGPDPLDMATDEITMRQRLREPRFQGRGLAALFLDQGFIAGMGNYLRAEVLFRARLDPSLRLGDLSAADVRALAAESLKTPRQSLSRRTTLRPRDAVRHSGAARSDAKHYVYGRAGRPCHRCRSTIRKKTMAGRALYWCPTCQTAQKA